MLVARGANNGDVVTMRTGPSLGEVARGAATQMHLIPVCFEWHAIFVDLYRRYKDIGHAQFWSAVHNITALPSSSDFTV